MGWFAKNGLPNDKGRYYKVLLETFYNCNLNRFI